MTPSLTGAALRLVSAAAAAAWVSGCASASPPVPETPPSPTAATSTRGTETSAAGTTAPGTAPRATGEDCAGGPGLIGSATWVLLDGRDSLEVVPARELRRCRLDTVPDAGWQEVLDLAPGADAPGMEEQYRCHVRFAPGKEVWHLEPWRPVVTGAELIASACNPGGADPELLP